MLRWTFVLNLHGDSVMKNFLLTLGFLFVGLLTLAPVAAHQARANVVPAVTASSVPMTAASIGTPPVLSGLSASSLPLGYGEVTHYDQKRGSFQFHCLG